MTAIAAADFHTVLSRCGIALQALEGKDISVRSPIDGTELASLAALPGAQVAQVIDHAVEAFRQWRVVPAPVRGELVRLWGEELRRAKSDIGHVISCEVGKIVQEGLGEVQEGVDICEFALGLSRQLHGKTIVSERPGHRIMEQYHPLGPVAVITAFNFPSAVFAWNAAIALVCGNPVIFKPSDKAPLSGLATFKALERAIARFGDRAPAGLAQIVLGGAAVAEALVDSPELRWYRPRGRAAWAAPWAPSWRRALASAFWSWAETTPWWSRPLPIWIWPCAPLSSAPWARPASAAPRCDA